MDEIGHGRGEFEAEAEAVYPALVRAATVLCWSKSDAEDVVQETLLSAFKSYGSFRREASFLTWTYAILARVASAMNRKRLRVVPSEYASAQADRLPPVDEGVISNEEFRVVIDAIRSLPERQREVVTLHFLEEIPYAEIAAGLGVAVGTVKATIFAAKISLRSALARQLSLSGAKLRAKERSS